jgi:maltooligosyltrehalose trehalohydrolase
MLDWYRTLIRLRREHTALTDPRVPVEVTVDDGLLRVQRGPVSLAANLGAAERTVDIEPGSQVLAASVALDAPSGRGLVLPVDSVVAWHAPRG